MRLLFVHADRMWYRVGRKGESAEDIPQSMREAELTDCLVAFSCVELYDEENPAEAAEQMFEEVTKMLETLKSDRVFIFPFAHLSQNLSKPEVALGILKEVEKRLAKKGATVVRAPFGWNKKFGLESKGHPMAVQSRSLCPKAAECRRRCPYCDRPLTV